MPSWCFNSINVKGSKSEVKKFKDALWATPAQYESTTEPKQELESKNIITMNGIVPVPDHILKVGYYDGNITSEQSRKMMNCEMEPGDGFHWQLINWGTKWDVDVIDFYEWAENEDDDCDCELTMSVHTAWNPIIPFIQKASIKFPKLKFYIHFEELGNMIVGHYNFVNGECTSKVVGDGTFESVLDYHILIDKVCLDSLFQDFVYDDGCRDNYDKIIEKWLEIFPEDKENIPTFEQALGEE